MVDPTLVIAAALYTAAIALSYYLGDIIDWWMKKRNDDRPLD